MPESSINEWDSRQHRRPLMLALLRALLTVIVLVALYYLLPIDDRWRLSSALRMVVGFILFVALLIWQIRKILTSKHPGIRAIEALAVTLPIFLLLFATTYFLMSVHAPGAFSEEHLTRTDALYLAVTIFTTVGFGDISAASQGARLTVTFQMLLDLVIIAVGLNAFVSAARAGRKRQAATEEADSASP